MAAVGGDVEVVHLDNLAQSAQGNYAKATNAKRRRASVEMDAMFARELEQIHQQEAATKLQLAARQRIARKDVGGRRATRDAADMLGLLCRCWLVRRRWEERRDEVRAAGSMQAGWRGRKARQRVKSMQRSNEEEATAAAVEAKTEARRVLHLETENALAKLNGGYVRGGVRTTEQETQRETELAAMRTQLVALCKHLCVYQTQIVKLRRELS